VLIVSFGPILHRGLEAADRLAAEGWSIGVINARFAKPLDAARIVAAARGARLVVTLEESVVTGGFGSGVLEALEAAALDDPALRAVPVKLIGLPGDRFVDHGSVTDLRHLTRLDVDGIEGQMREALGAAGVTPANAPRPLRARTA
jgi:1-deoxy-D-xylulose-5-phosphate synthase